MIPMEEIKSALQPVDVAKILGIPKEVFIRLPQRKKIELLRLVYSGRIFQEYNNHNDLYK